MATETKHQIAVFGGGCFWCTEAIFAELRGVVSAISGYAGGTTERPTYEEVCAGKSGHAEAVKIEFDPAEVSYPDLLEVFFAVHNPTTKNRQGSDIGSQYRSVIFYVSEDQKREAAEAIEKLRRGGVPAVTELAPFVRFFPAEEYHQAYYEKNPRAPYCEVVISPKLEALKEKFGKLLKAK